MSEETVTQAEPVRRCGACCAELVRRYKEGGSAFRRRKYCNTKCLAVVNSARFSSKKRGGDR